MTGQIAQQLLNLITLGSIYAMIAVGFSLLFGVLNITSISTPSPRLTDAGRRWC